MDFLVSVFCRQKAGVLLERPAKLFRVGVAERCGYIVDVLVRICKQALGFMYSAQGYYLFGGLACRGLYYAAQVVCRHAQLGGVERDIALFLEVLVNKGVKSVCDRRFSCVLRLFAVLPPPTLSGYGQAA